MSGLLLVFEVILMPPHIYWEALRVGGMVMTVGSGVTYRNFLKIGSIIF